MSNIVVRGKSIYTIQELEELEFTDNDHENGWFTGGLVWSGDVPYIVGDLIEVHSEYVIHDFWMPVHVDSIGRYTGILDKDMAEIYERDAIETDLSKNYGVVVFRDGAFMLKLEDEGEEFYDIMFPISNKENEVYEWGKVIGNTFDNSYT